MVAVPFDPSSAGPRIGVEVLPLASKVAPPVVPWPDSTPPIPASVVQPRWQPGRSRASRNDAVPYALTATVPMPVARDALVTHAGDARSCPVFGASTRAVGATGTTDSSECGAAVPVERI